MFGVVVPARHVNEQCLLELYELEFEPKVELTQVT